MSLFGSKKTTPDAESGQAKEIPPSPTGMEGDPLEQLWNEFKSRFQRLLPAGPTSTNSPTRISLESTNHSLIEKEIFSAALIDNLEIAADRRTLAEAFSRNAPTARALVAQLLYLEALANDAKNETMEKDEKGREMVETVRKIGKALYAYSPKPGREELPLEKALLEWIQNIFAATSLKHKVELVTVGDRYDQHRHLTLENGVTVKEVKGWCIKRGDGVAMYKAPVTLK